MIEACEGSVSGTCARAWENSTPRAERPSRWGVFAPPRWSARVVSSVIRRMLAPRGAEALEGFSIRRQPGDRRRNKPATHGTKPLYFRALKQINLRPLGVPDPACAFGVLNRIG